MTQFRAMLTITSSLPYFSIAFGIIVVLITAIDYLYLVYKFEKLDIDEGFCKHINNHLFCQDI